MSDIIIRIMDQDEVQTLTRMLTRYAFSPSPPLPTYEAWAHDMEIYGTHTLYIGVFEHGKVLACAGVTTLTQNIRGQLYAGGGVCDVSVHPEARRRGIARSMIKYIFQHLYEHGIPTSQLSAFRESFYTRLGYTTFTLPHIVRFSPVALQPLLKKDLGGSVELLELAKNVQPYLDFLQQMQQKVHGMALFAPARSVKDRQSKQAWLALARVEGRVVGAMTYKITNNKEDMKVDSFWYENAQGRYLLLEWFARHIDHANTIEIRLPSYERPETWWPDMEIQLGSVVTDTPLLGRLVDITRLSGMQSGPGQATIAIKDEYCPWNEGTYSFESNDGKLHIERSAQTPDCTLSIQGLSGLIYGTHEPQSFAIREWGNPSPQVQETLLSLFPPKEPYLFERF